MRIRSQILVLACLLLICGGVSATARAGDDPSIQGAQRKGIQGAMQEFVRGADVGGRVLHYDPVAGSLLRLKLVELHEGIVRKGDFFVSCADFVDERGAKYDLDFLVLSGGERFRVSQAIVHAVDGDKRDYHLEGR